METPDTQEVAFWSAIAQIVPVVGLALVLEARILAQRLSKKRSRLLRRFRYFWGIWIYVTITLLLAVAYVSLDHLSGGALPFNASAGDRIFASIAILNGLILVTALPSYRIYSATTKSRSTVDPFAHYWSKGNWLIRRYDAFSADDRSALRTLRDARHHALMHVSRLTVAKSRAMSQMESAKRTAAQANLTSPEATTVRGTLTRIGFVQRELDEQYALAVAVLEDVNSATAEVEELHNKTQKRMRKLRRLKTTSAKEADEYVRKAISRSSR